MLTTTAQRLVIRAAALIPRQLRQASAHADLVHWTRQHPAPMFATREALYAAVHAGLEAIDYLEFGVAEGASLRSWVTLNPSPASRFIGFDSFRGLPEAWHTGAQIKPAGTFGRAGRPPAIDDPRVHFVEGWFQDTVPAFVESFKPQSPLIVHLDADLYSSTLYVLTMLDRLMADGAVLIFDEFHVADHEFRAFMDYVAAYRRAYTVLGATPGRVCNRQVAIRLLAHQSMNPPEDIPVPI